MSTDRRGPLAPRVLTPDEVLAEIRRIYFSTSRATIERDVARALDLLKALPGEADRERATVFMHGLAEMRRDWRGPTARRPPQRRS